MPPKRSRSKQPQPTTDNLSKARSSLHVNNCPDVLPCREEEFGNVQYILESAITEQKGACLYISGMHFSHPALTPPLKGVPGSGKTATVSRVIRDLESDPDVPAFDYHVINANKLASPASAVTLLYKSLSGREEDHVSDSIAAARIQNVLDSLTRPAIVFIGILKHALTKYP
jgi:origin recognition complex subunit 1